MTPEVSQPFMKVIRKKQVQKCSREKSDELIKKMRKEHEKLVKGKFEFIDAQGGWLDFTYRIFPDEDVAVYKLYHGVTYELPLGLVKHLNNTKKKIRTFGNADPTKATPYNGRGIPTTYETQSRVRFTPVDMM